MRRSMLTQLPMAAPPPPYIKVIGNEEGNGAGFIPQGGQYYFSDIGSGASILKEIGVGTQSSTGTITMLVIDEGNVIVQWWDVDTALGSVIIPDLPLSDEYRIGFWRAATGGSVAGDVGLTSAPGQSSPLAIGIGNPVPSLSYVSGDPAAWGYGVLA